jgi:nucleoside-diphosphate-sugar epimerase
VTVVILGCGYTGERVARRMAASGERVTRVICTSRRPERLSHLDGIEPIRLHLRDDTSLAFVPPGSLVLHSIPPVDEVPASELIHALADLPKRVVYLSTTGVYGDQRDVDASTAPSPRHDRDLQRLEAEQAVLNGPWSSLVLRPAAIYGPGRGIHVSMAEGRFKLVGTGENYVSRIHVDDLAAHVEAALLSDVGGAWPVADDHACTSLEIARYCSELLSVPMPPSISEAGVHHTRRADRRVDGRAIREQLGITLRYPSYLSGIPASIRPAA